jgi:phthiodiolone/phenolphthiodiolone dimycocerosates ketoreductase
MGVASAPAGSRQTGRGTRPRVRVGLLWVPSAPLGNIANAIRLARMARLDFMLFGDHVQSFVPRTVFDERLGYWAHHDRSPHELYEVFTLLGRVSGSVGGMQLGTGVVDVVRHHPVQLAQAALTMAQFTRRRFILGVGAGEREGTEPYGLDPAPRVDRVDEAVRYVRAAFASAGASFDFQGRYFSADHAVLDLAAPPGRPPLIWIAANGPRMLALAGRCGDGWLPVQIKDAAEYERSLRVVREGAVGAGRDPDDVTPANELNLMVAATERDARGLLGSRVARYTAAMHQPASLWRAAGREHPFGDAYGGYRDILPEMLDAALIEEAIRTVPPEIVERTFVWGTPDQVVRQVADLRDAGLRSLCFIPASFHTPRRVFYTFWALASIARRMR